MYADKKREAFTDLLHTRVFEIINLIKRYAAYSSFPRSELDTTFQELIEYYYPNR